MPQADNPDLTDEADEVLGRADAFMRRRRSVPDEIPADDDIPLLTDIVPMPAPRAILEELADPAVFQRPRRGPQGEPEARPATEAAPEMFEPEPEGEPAPLPQPETVDELDFDLGGEPEPEPVAELLPEPGPGVEATAEESVVSVDAPAPVQVPIQAPVQPQGLTTAAIEALVAARVEAAVLQGHQELAIALDDWLNFDLPRLVSREIDGIAERIVKKAGEELRALLQAGLPPED